jgi:tetratricopeptide (TPR) repeat protein
VTESALQNNPNSDVTSSIAEWSTAARTIFINGLVITSLSVVLVVTAVEVLRNAFVVDEFGMPAPLMELGYSGSVASTRLLDEIHAVNDAELVGRRQRLPMITASELPDIAEPTSGISLRGVAQMLRSLFRLEQRRIAGEFVCHDEKCSVDKIELRIRVFQNGEMRQITAGELGPVSDEKQVQEYFRSAALEVLKVIDPLTAAYYTANKDRDASEAIALRLVSQGGDDSAAAAAHVGRLKSEMGRFIEAEEWFRKALKLPTEDREADDGFTYVMWGQTLESKGDLAEARRKYDEAIRLLASRKNSSSKYCSHILNALGFAHLAIENSASALSSFDSALSCDREYVNSYFGKGLAFNGQGKIDEASEQFLLGTIVRPNDAYAYLNWGDFLYSIGEIEAAEQKFTMALDVSDSDPLSLLSWGNSLFNIDDYSGAAEKYSRAVKLDPENFYARLNWGVALASNNEHAKAIVQFEAAAKINEESPELFAEWGKSLYAIDRNSEASKKFRAAIEVSGDDGYWIDQWRRSWRESLKQRGLFQDVIEETELSADPAADAERLYGLWSEAFRREFVEGEQVDCEGMDEFDRPSFQEVSQLDPDEFANSYIHDLIEKCTDPEPAP